jgi:succinoglycan biosynthesis transport protein ExoP
MRKMLTDRTGGAIIPGGGSAALGRAGSDFDLLSPSAPLLEVLWRRRWTLALTVLACLLLTAAYLAVATPIYSGTAKVFVQQYGPRIFSDSSGFFAQSDSYLQTQADVFQTMPVLERALKSSNYQSMRTFADVQGDPLTWLRNSGALKVEVAKKSDTILVTMESAYPAEAASFANAVVAAFIAEQSQQKQSTGSEMVQVLQQQKQQLQRERDSALQAMIRSKRSAGVLTFREGEKGNTILERAAALSDSLTKSEISVMELQSQKEAITDALQTPQSIAHFVEAQQSKGRDFGDREYDELRSQLTQSELAISTARAVQGPNHSHVQVLQRVIDQLKDRIAQKERAIVESQLASVCSQLAAAEETAARLRSAEQTHTGAAMDVVSSATEYAKLTGDVERLQRQCDLIDNRIAEISVNSIASAPLDIRVLEPARAEQSPVKPRKTLSLAAALMAGVVLGIGMAMLREWQDVRLRKPEEIMELLGTPVIASIPRVNPRLSAVTRGQLVRLDPRSPAAEAYRGIRTSLHLGTAGGGAKTILLASPTSGDGKSTIASNLAIAFAQAGDRTLLVDCDLRHPVQHLIFESDGAVGLANVMSEDEKLRDALRPTNVPGLYLLPCGQVPENPSELLASKRFARLMSALGETFDRIIIDSPPVMAATDARILAASADATLLVLRMNRSMRQLGVLALEGLQQVGANVVGAIANDVPSAPSYSNYGGSWQYAKHSSRLFSSGNGHSATARLPMDALAIKEPDWSPTDPTHGSAPLS